MIFVVVTGGIGSGKSTVSAGLARRSAAVIDADQIAREIVEPGTPALREIVERFGVGMLGADGTLDRPGLAKLVFNDRDALDALNKITHPAINAELYVRARELRAKAEVVVFDLPLVDGDTRERFGAAGVPVSAVAVVDVPPETALARLVGERGMSETDARARMASQMARQQRLDLGDLIIDNSGSVEKLEAELDRAWAWIEGRGVTARR